MSLSSLNSYLSRFVSHTRLQKIDQVLDLRTSRIRLVFDTLCDPHNISACLRTAESFGVQYIHIVNNTQNGKKKKAPLHSDISTSSHKWLTIYQHQNYSECITELKKLNYKLWVTNLSEKAISMDTVTAKDHEESERQHGVVYPSDKLALIFGNEHNGVSTDLSNARDENFILPMVGFSQSFNVSVSVGVALAYCKTLGLLKADLTEQEKEQFRSIWLRDSIGVSADSLVKKWESEANANQS
eukprot:TRINITY_DN1858_c0_g1_i1.p1 TRINITY_DN1858_c0_g1~~TRINITY_DN1858_c0_g1_i1.p1  ORF type:complete len:242 (+),score=38.49 TRINITY_DN1858_c0_g1_i1:121-846(+)